MLSISKAEFSALAEQYNTVPLSADVFADTKTPIQLFHLFNEEAAFLLESKDKLSPWSNYSFIGLNPVYYFYDKEDTFVFAHKNGEILFEQTDFEQTWSQAMNYLNVSPDGPSLPFPGGAVGYVGFEGAGIYEPRLKREKKENEHDVCFMFCETILAFQHDSEELTVIHLQNTGASDQTAAYEEGHDRIRFILDKIEKDEGESVSIVPVVKPEEDDIFRNVTSNFTKEKFLNQVEKVKEYIAAGDIFQAVLSQRFETPVKSDGLTLYRTLRKINPSPYLYYIRFEDQEIIGSSPERLVKIEEDREMEIHPIAGTRKRGKTTEEDRLLAEELLDDEKERAEHLMLVDLARNDMGRVSEYGSVNVKDMMHVAYFSHVMHIISKVTGRLHKDYHPFEALFSAHPAGTVSGAPKVRAVEIIQEMEQMRRGVYAGAIAYCGFNQAIDSCIAIRTIILKDKTAYVQAGAGIVQDSVPESEYEETRNKAKALLYAIKSAEQRYEHEEAFQR